MATPQPYSKKSHFTPPHHKKTSKSSSCSNILCKSLILILVLVIIPMFPSQAPDFIRQSIFPELWELLHLMFIGIAVCYGLFSKRRSHTDKVDLETHPRFDPPNPYLSGISNVSSIFDNGYENLYGSCEKIVSDNGYENLYGSSEKIAMPETRGFQNFLGKENSFVNRNGVNFSQYLNSQHILGESNVVLANRYHRTKSLSHIDHKPLGLPVRSLRSRIANDTDNNPECCDIEIEKSPNLFGSGGSFGSFMGDDINGVSSEKEFEANSQRLRSRRRREMGEVSNKVNKPTSQYYRSQSASEFEFRQFRHFRTASFQQPPSSRSSSTASSQGPTPSEEQNFEGKMDLEELPVLGDEAESSTGSSGEMNMEIEDEFDDDMTKVCLGRQEVSYGKPPLHSIGESDHEDIETWSFWHPTPSETNSKSSSPTKDSRSPILPASPELPSVEMHDHREKKDVVAPSISVPHPVVTSIDGAAKFITSRNQCPSPMEINAHGNLRDTHKDVGKRIGSLDSSRVKPSARPKVSLRGKSVRTIRPSRLGDDLKSNDSASVKSRICVSPPKSLSSVKGINGIGCENGPINTIPDSAFSPKKNRKKEEESVIGEILESREDSVSVMNNSDSSSDEEEKSGSFLVDDVELGSEVDRKAGEFIAKFREQIRLQKIESFRRSST